MSRSPFERPMQFASGLVGDLLDLGVEPGTTLVVHSSLSKIGWVLGGAQTVVSAILDTVGKGGTVAMPGATPFCADPGDWPGSQVPAERLDEVREHLPIFDRKTTPTAMGAIPECFRTWPGTLRSDHPLESVSARGRLAEEITNSHPLPFSEGEAGAWGRLYEADSQILLLGVGFNRCTALHFAESLGENRRTTTNRYPILENGKRVWVEVPDMASDNDTHFPRVGERFLDTGKAQSARVGEAHAVLFSMTDLVVTAREYFEEHLP